MPQSLNLIPEQEVQEQTKTQLVKFSTVIFIFILIGVSATAAYFLYATSALKTKVKDEEDKISKLRSDINNMSSIEIGARNLGKKYNILKEMLDKRTYNSLLLEEMRARQPQDIFIETFSITKDFKLSISGTAQNYITIKTYTNNLLSDDYKPGNPKLKGLFKSVMINQIDLNNDGSVNFSMLIEADKTRLAYVQ